MVRLTGPHFSITALGKWGKVTVYSVWKGVQYARMLVTPTNPQSGAQGDARQITGGLGRSPKYCQVDKTFTNFAKAVTPAGQSWISYIVQYNRDTYMPDTEGFEAMDVELTAHGQNAKFGSAAAALGLADLAVPYRSVGIGFGCGLMLYMLAKFATAQYLLDNTKFNAAPYTKALATWDAADVDLMVADFTA